MSHHNLTFVPARLKAYVGKLKYFLGFSPTYHPSQGGVDIYRKKSSWPLRIDLCPCDKHFVEYLHDTGIEGKVIFHFGTGEHHHVGVKNAKVSHPNHIIGITAAAREHSAFVDLTFENKSLAKHYSVLFKDIYTLTSENLPHLDYASLFHLCEFYIPGNAANVHHDDKSLLDLFISRLNPKGRILFYTGSFAWKKASMIVQAFEREGRIREVGKFQSLAIYEKT